MANSYSIPVHVVESSTFQDWKLVLLSPWGGIGLILAVATVAVALFLTAWGYRRQARWSIRFLLFSLRAISLFALLFLVLQPAIQIRSGTLVPNHVAVLLDLSRSMSIKEEKDGPPRLERAMDLIKRSAARLEQWKRQRRVVFYSFGASLEPLNFLARGLQANEPATQVQNALADVQRRYQAKDLAAVILISDGIDNGQLGTGPLSLASRQFLQRLKTPIHTLWVGQAHIQDLALAEVFADDFAFVRNVVQVEADLIVQGLDVDHIPVILTSNGSTVAQREVKIMKGVSRYRVQFEFVPPRVGKYVYTISAPLYAGEAITINNSRSFLLKVIRDRIRVLQVCGRPSWDERFLRQLLKRDPNVDLISFFILRTPADLTLVPPTDLSLIPFPTEELFEKELGSFDLVLLQNFNYKPYGIGQYLPHLRRYVEDGGGLAMIGGDLSFSSGEYGGTPLAEVLPVQLLPDAPDRSRLISVEDFRPRITAEGHDHPILQVGPSRQETEQILASLPSLSGMNLLAGAMPNATVLAVHPTLKDSADQAMPLLATREVKKGRTLSLATDSSWYWAFLSVGAGGTRKAYDRFWRNAIRWLIQDPELKYLRVIIQQESIRLGSSFRALIRAYNPDYSPAKKLKVRYKITSLSGDTEVAKRAVTDSEGEIHLEHRPKAEGPYLLQAIADLAGRPTAEEDLLLVEPAGLEEREPRATPALLKQISEVTGGRYLGQNSPLPELPFREPRVLHVNWRKDVELWSHWWSLLACIIFFGLEWHIRRRYGYL